MSVEMFLFMKCMWFIAKCLICFYIICGLSYLITIERIERILGIKNPPSENGSFVTVGKTIEDINN